MKKSNKISIIYILSSMLLLGTMIFGGIYGMYISVGLNFVRSSVSNVTSGGAAGGASNVAFGGTINFESSMTGIIILSIILIILSIFDIISLIRQIVLFKQFKMVRNSKFEIAVENKVKSKGAVIFLASLIDILSLVAGIAGIFLNARTFVGNNLAWVLYLVDGAVSILALTSLVLLIIKVNQAKKYMENHKKNVKNGMRYYDSISRKDDIENSGFDIDKIEYSLLKLKYLKNSRIISAEECEMLRNKILDTKVEEDEEN